MITQRQLDGIRQAIAKLDKSTMDAVIRAVERIDFSDTDALRAVLIDELRPVVSMSADMASELAATVYNEWRLADIGEQVAVSTVSAFNDGKYAAMVNTALGSQTVDEFMGVVSGYVGYTNRASYSDTLFDAGRKDAMKPKFARVPQGGETCAFCMMLASRGFVYNNGNYGQKVHNHANCDCVYVASWSKTPAAEGYDEDYWYNKWKEATSKPSEQSGN